MSSTIRNGSQRRSGDDYQTPGELAEFLVAKLVADGILCGPEPRVLEPSAGDGSFVAALRKYCDPGVLVANEPYLTDARRVAYETAGAEWWPTAFEKHLLQPRWSAVVGNPPYSLAEQHVRKALEVAAKRGGVVAFLLRLAFLESRGRFALWRDFPLRKLYVLSERPSFTGGGTDSAAYGFFVWENGNERSTELEVVSWKGAVTLVADPPDKRRILELPEWPE